MADAAVLFSKGRDKRWGRYTNGDGVTKHLFKQLTHQQPTPTNNTPT